MSKELLKLNLLVFPGKVKSTTQNKTSIIEKEDPRTQTKLSNIDLERKAF
jgi:hypothetical protein